ncbi:MAG TPA: response regulator [Desulfopila sp.]|nr:response regulator [Desulfopila sp.]
MKTILYIEDDPSLRQLVDFMLQKRDDVRFLQEETGAAGIQTARECRPDIILLDLSLPDISGYEVLPRLKNDNGTGAIPVIALSGDSLPEDVARGIEAGFDAYLTKPLGVSDFYSLIDRMLDSDS